MIVTFVHHSCFVVETSERVLIFDYFQNGRIKGYHFTGVLPEFDRKKPLYVFASHFHQDHFKMGAGISQNSLYFIERHPSFGAFSGEKRDFPFYKRKDYVCPAWKKL